MVKIAAPPPIKSPDPQLHEIQEGEELLRLYDPERFSAGALTFRHFGPLRRFDHHRSDSAAEDPDRGILYAGSSLSGCLVEIFGDSKVVEVGSWVVAKIKVKAQLRLLDLRGGNAMKAGTVAAICKDSNHRFSQDWSRFFYDSGYVYSQIDGIIFGNAHNDEDAFALYERAENKLETVDTCQLKDEALRWEILSTVSQFNMTVIPY